MAEQFGGGGPLAWIAHEHLLEKGEQIGTDLGGVLQLGRRHVANATHRLQRRLIEEGRLAVDHLDDHDAQRPDVHLGAVRQTGDD